MPRHHDGGPAFPRAYSAHQQTDDTYAAQRGMSLRQLYAAVAMSSLIYPSGEQPDFTAVAEDAFAFADAMLRVEAE